MWFLRWCVCAGGILEFILIRWPNQFILCFSMYGTAVPVLFLWWVWCLRFSSCLILCYLLPFSSISFHKWLFSPSFFVFFFRMLSKKTHWSFGMNIVSVSCLFHFIWTFGCCWSSLVSHFICMLCSRSFMFFPFSQPNYSKYTIKILKYPSVLICFGVNWW